MRKMAQISLLFTVLTIPAALVVGMSTLTPSDLGPFKGPVKHIYQRLAQLPEAPRDIGLPIGPKRPGDTSGTAPAVAAPAPDSPEAAKTIGTLDHLPLTKLSGRVDEITTASGVWRIERVASKGNIRAYRWTLAGKPEWKRLVVVRGLALAPMKTLDEARITIDGISMTVAPGAVRVWQNDSPVAWRWDWLRQAVLDGRTPAIGDNPTRTSIRPLTPPDIPPYDPTTITPLRSGTPATSSSNSVGVTSGQGGEYDASRGFYHNYDATAVQIAQAGRNNEGLARFLERITLDQLSHPQAAEWSSRHDGLADPQFPYPGDSVVAPRISMPKWGRDTQHLENACWAHWLATADPLAALCVQRQTAFMLQQNPIAWRSKDGRYSYAQGIERTNWNALVTAWKSRDIGRHVHATGKTLLNRARTEKIFNDLVLWTDQKVVQPIIGQPRPPASLRTSGNVVETAAFARYSARLSGAIMHSVGGCTLFRIEKNGEKTYFAATPDFMTGQYGGAIMPLLVRDGNQTARKWAPYIAQFLVTRLGRVGGYRGIEGTEEMRGSMLAIGPGVFEARITNWGPKTQGWCDMPPYTDAAGYAKWLNSFNRGPNDSFGNAAEPNGGTNIHTAVQMHKMLESLRELGIRVDGMDAAIDKNAQMMANAPTSAWRHYLTAKHLNEVRMRYDELK